ncbi:nuclear transport factor 2 family protein [Streptomyces sporangiiformans]|uniref:Nuclear transport factor 2 family protein n=1 Tax=Streptomyces sporangiiformans TaxID=2315329 RepID=A0A505DD28_9ACTN|nr:nuclear transport factor 2 family protein [Streptomyces sporangiiformans]TPQ20737.1 nuclear transport factor 2 family protein [Streptomyces sporangiiformans]
MKPTNEDTVEIARVLALWGHIMDDRELDRLGEVLTEDAVWDGSAFGFEPVVGLDAITAVLSADGHARAHHTTNIVVSEGPGDEVRARSKGLGVVGGGTVISVVHADELRRTDGGWRISRRAIHVI